MPSRWQIDVLTYAESDSYPVLLLQPGEIADHDGLFTLLSAAGMAAPSTWEWTRHLWPLVPSGSVELSVEPAAVTVYAGGRSLAVGFDPTEPPMSWVFAACRQRQVLFVLLPPRPGFRDDALILDDINELDLPAQWHGCLAGSIPFMPSVHRQGP
ncbi:hypothetical protein VA596_15810 [Amycolatopsis sp., V23-08]|uniref:Uncharacterized protein n=1 Tax=Amycolatopsis heterodermiae TaxID=3110235 RepID=A0ABU5R583_9PSEU|nr:hypothetical protein [Amycolatopsis sp., V23-08]MEA5361010.1 hypothetical protein [Amycolatopsis sp., V23-08]